MENLTFSEYPVVQNCLLQIKYQTVVHTILSNQTPGLIYVDNKRKPEIAFAQFKQRTFLSGSPDSDKSKLLKDFILTEVQENCKKFSVPFVRLSFNDHLWLDILIKSLKAYDPMVAGYHCYQKNISDFIIDCAIPNGFDLLPVNEALVNQDFPGKAYLLEEMCSERESVEAFLDKSFGVVAFKDGALAGWCLSEYNFKDQCEVGIATNTPYQRLGLGKAMTFCFLNQAREFGVKRVLWHCNQSNKPSQLTALSASFELVDKHQVLIINW
jgi:hypothetical protein